MICDICKDRKWLFILNADTDKYEIQRCDDCQSISDEEAEEIAKEQGFIVRNDRLANKNTGKFIKLD